MNSSVKTSQACSFSVFWFFLFITGYLDPAGPFQFISSLLLSYFLLASFKSGLKDKIFYPKVILNLFICEPDPFSTSAPYSVH